MASRERSSGIVDERGKSVKQITFTITGAYDIADGVSAKDALEQLEEVVETIRGYASVKAVIHLPESEITL